MDFYDNLTSIEEYLCKIATIKKQPIGGSIELLPLCNMNCDMCYVRLSYEEMQSQGRLRTANEWITLGKEMQKAGVLFLLLTGGEPFLHPDFKEIYLELYKLGIILTINTNGSLITEDLAFFLGKHPPRRVNVTLYGSNNITYEKLCHTPNGFEQTLKGIQLLLKNNVPVKLNASLVQNNLCDLDEIIHLSQELGLFLKVDTYMYPVTRERTRPFSEDSRLSAKETAAYDIKINKKQMTSEEFSFYRQEMLAFSSTPDTKNSFPITCRAGRSSFMINWQGIMQPCAMVTTPSIDVFKTGFINSWNYLTQKIATLFLSNTCASCQMRKICQTCAGCAISETGSIDGVPKYMCDYITEKVNLLKKEIYI